MKWRDYFIDKRKLHRHIHFRMKIMVAMMLLCVMGLVVRLANLQIIDHKHYTTLSRKNHLVMLPIEPSRGIITDCRGVILADNQPQFSLDVVPEYASHFQLMLDTLAEIGIAVPHESIEAYEQALPYRKKYQPVVLKSRLNEKEVAQYYLHQYKLPGVSIQPHMYRVYPQKEDFAHIVGYTGRLNAADRNHLDVNNYTHDADVGKTALERQFEKSLHGHMGYQQVEVDAKGSAVRQLQTIDAVPGTPLQLTVDARLQKIAYDALKKHEGSVVVLDAKNGGILAMASAPSFDPNLFVGGISHQDYQRLMKNQDKPLYNRSIQGAYAPGSTIKPFLALGGLDRGLITAKTRFRDPGWYKLPNSDHKYHDWNWYRGGHGTVDVRKSLIVSCDTFYYRLANAMGIHVLSDVLGQFHFGERTHVELPGESAGILPTPDWKRGRMGAPWYPGDTVVTGIGQGYLLATPLQLARATMLLANHGVDHPVTLVKAKADMVFSAHGLVLQDASHWALIDDALEQVINSVKPWGTGAAFGRNPPHRVAAKTGTTQVYSIKRREVNGMIDQNKLPKKLRDHALFIAYTPIEKPAIVVVVVVEHDYTYLAARIARKLVNAYDKLYGLKIVDVPKDADTTS